MDELIKTFHIDWKLLLAQIINFGIVLFVLWRFALKPLMKVMEKRGKEIEKSLDDAKKIEENLARTEQEREEKILQAKKEASQIIEEARNQGQIQGHKLVENAKAEVQTVIAGAKEQIAQEKVKILSDIKSEVSGLVIETTKKVLSETMNENMDSKIIEKSLDKIKS